MKKFLYIALLGTLLIGIGSCKDYLDVNVNPDYPTNVVASASSRLPWIQHHYGYSYGAASVRASLITGTITSRTFTGTNGTLPAWNPVISASTTPYQQWFVGSAANLNDIMAKAEEEEAWHYLGAAHTLKAMGFMLMVDWYGEMPYTDALGSSLTPVYDDGKTIYEGCFAELDKALEYFQMTQPATASPLSAGDNWNGGDVQKWIKLIYGLKARWLNNISKKADYDPAAILDAIAKGPQSNAEGTVIDHVNDPADLTGDVLFGDPLKTAFIFDSGAWSDWARFTQWYVDLLENTFTGGSGVEDPRTDKMLPSAQHWIAQKDEQSGDVTYTSQFIRTKGVDVINSNIRLQNGPSFVNYDTEKKAYSVSSTAADRQGDTVYVNIKALCAMTGATSEESTYKASDGTVLSTGTFYSRPESPTDIITFHEMCFIKAEVLFRQGKVGEALTAYQAGIRAHMEYMNDKLKEYAGSENPGKQPMDEAAIDAFMTSAAVAQTASELTMAKIMQQKFIAMSFTQQNWNDMRRFNFSAGNIGSFGVVYPGYDRPKEFGSVAATKIPGGSKTDVNYWFRRMAQCSHEVNYNSDNLAASNPKAFDTDIWSVPVWWDTED